MKSRVRWRGVKSPSVGWTCESISPGRTVAPAASIARSMPVASTSPSAPTPAIRPSRTTTVSPSSRAASMFPETMVPAFLITRSAMLASSRSRGPRRRLRLRPPPLPLQGRQHVVQGRHHSEVRLDVIQRGLLLSLAGARDALPRDDDLVAAEEGVVHGRAHADVGHDARGDHGLDPQLTEAEIEVGLVEPTVAAFPDPVLALRGLEGLDDTCAPRPFDAVRDPLLELLVLLGVLVADPDHRDPRVPR